MTSSPVSGKDAQCPKIYAASRASVPERPAMWKRFRDSGVQIVSSWIDEAEPGATADLGELWVRINREIASADRLVLYAMKDDFPLKGAFIEVGIALALGKPVAVVTPDFVPIAPSYRPIGSWIKHPLVRHCGIAEALSSWHSTPAEPINESRMVDSMFGAVLGTPSGETAQQCAFCLKQPDTNCDACGRLVCEDHRITGHECDYCPFCDPNRKFEVGAPPLKVCRYGSEHPANVLCGPECGNDPSPSVEPQFPAPWIVVKSRDDLPSCETRTWAFVRGTGPRFAICTKLFDKPWNICSDSPALGQWYRDELESVAAYINLDAIPWKEHSNVRS